MKKEEFWRRFIVASFIIGATWGFVSIILFAIDFPLIKDINENWYIFLSLSLVFFVIGFFLLSRKGLGLE